MTDEEIEEIRWLLAKRAPWDDNAMAEKLLGEVRRQRAILDRIHKAVVSIEDREDIGPAENLSFYLDVASALAANE